MNSHLVLQPQITGFAYTFPPNEDEICPLLVRVYRTQFEEKVGAEKKNNLKDQQL